jgi:hypothetical protein
MRAPERPRRHGRQRELLRLRPLAYTWAMVCKRFAQRW